MRVECPHAWRWFGLGDRECASLCGLWPSPYTHAYVSIHTHTHTNTTGRRFDRGPQAPARPRAGPHPAGGRLCHGAGAGEWQPEPVAFHRYESCMCVRWACRSGGMCVALSPVQSAGTWMCAGRNVCVCMLACARRCFCGCMPVYASSRSVISFQRCMCSHA